MQGLYLVVHQQIFKAQPLGITFSISSLTFNYLHLYIMAGILYLDSNNFELNHIYFDRLSTISQYLL